ncbi:MAG: hypothetical protein ABI635_10870, partial [Actinomycetota bacterium]
TRVSTPASTTSRAAVKPDRARATEPSSDRSAPRDDEAVGWLEDLALQAETESPVSSTEVLAQAAAQAGSVIAPEDETWEDDSATRTGTRGGAGVTAETPSSTSADRRVVVIDDDIDIPVTPPHAPPPLDEPRTAGARVGATLEDEGPAKKRWRLFRKGGE